MSVQLHPLDATNLGALRALAVADARPEEVMPVVDGPGGWTARRITAFDEFYRARLSGLAGDLRTAMYVVSSAGRTAGMIRMTWKPDDQPSVETGMWLGRSVRGRGIGAAALAALLGQARRAGAEVVVADTTPDNAAAQATLRRLGAVLSATGDTVYARIDLGGS